MLPPLRHIAPPWAGGRRAALNFLIVRSGLILCGLFLLAGLVLAGDYGINHDAANQRQTALANLNYILGQADRIESYFYHDRVYGVAFELPLLLAEGALGLADYSQVHRLRLTLTHLFFILGGFFCYRLAYQLFGSRLLAILALLFYLLHPRLYANSYLNSKDLPFLSMFAITLYLLERAFRRDTAGAFILLGLAVGLLTNLRIMGAALFPAIIAMRGLDWRGAEAGAERGNILRTVGLFALTAGLTVYALSPYAWTNPIDYLVTNLNLTIDHPTVVSQLFQGERFASDRLPPHYNATWFGITAPPLVLLTGFIGIGAVAARGLARPAAVFRNARLRLQWLLLACFLLPPLAAALLGSNQYEGWRHFYFLYAPFCLLAAGGVHWLAVGLGRQRSWRLGVYGLAGLGLGLLLLQMAQIHPWQHSYFNFLVDRTTPEYLRTQYDLERWTLAQRAGLEYLLAEHPGETLVVPSGLRQRKILAAAARQRLLSAGGDRRADYDLIYGIDAVQPDLAFNLAYQRRLYNNTVIGVRPLAAARMTAAARAAYGEIYRQAMAGEPIFRADYNVYLADNRLTFVKENCSADDRDVRFEARFFPHYPEILPPYLWNPGSYVTFQNRRVRLGAVCLAVIQLPDYAQGDLFLAQRVADGHNPGDLPLWEGLYSRSRPGLGELIADQRRGKGAAGGFDVFLDQDAGRNRLIYAKGDCTPAEYATRVTLHITPVDGGDLPGYNRGRSFDNRDFPIDYYGGRPGGECVAVVPLPDYPIAAIRTGQAREWEVNLYPPPAPNILRATYAALSDIQPEARADFDLYHQDNRLVYLRETCVAADVAAGFFLHIIPVDGADLPAERRAAGFANRDFVFERWGGHFDGKCLAAVALPDYPIKEIRTGQHIPGQGEGWAVELAGER